jgi:CHAT domain-containing protein
LIEYYLGKERSYLILITDKSFYLRELSSRREIYDSLRAYLKVISEKPSGEFKGVKASLRLYEELISPIQSMIDNSTKNLIIIPDGILCYLPFESLMSQNNGIGSAKNEFLIERYNISYMPSASSLLLLQKNRKEKQFKKDLLALGNPKYRVRNSKQLNPFSPAQILFNIYDSLGFSFSPLPYSELEVERISKHFDEDKKSVYLSENANESAFKGIPLTDFRIIHFACHGFVDEQFPLRSALVLSLLNNEKEDGFLQAREIYNLRISSEIVVLSACQSGIGKLEPGEGSLGLSRVFFFAGAKSVVATLWEIGDKPTAIFSDNFYKYLLNGDSKAVALKNAKIDMINSNYSHPFYWAAFILSGEYRTPIF